MLETLVAAGLVLAVAAGFIVLLWLLARMRTTEVRGGRAEEYLSDKDVEGLLGDTRDGVDGEQTETHND